MKAKEIRVMTVEEINNRISDLKDQLFKLKMQKSMGQADNLFKIRNTRHDIARCYTILSEKEVKK
jgi:large subunit ribosomal protein L29